MTALPEWIENSGEPQSYELRKAVTIAWEALNYSKCDEGILCLHQECMHTRKAMQKIAALGKE